MTHSNSNTSNMIQYKLYFRHKNNMHCIYCINAEIISFFIKHEKVDVIGIKTATDKLGYN